MNANWIIRMVLRRLIGRAVNAGLRHAAGSGKRRPQKDAGLSPQRKLRSATSRIPRIKPGRW
ncbi:hypothetical protein KUW17_01110 [Leisingera aquaemixtae]|uniref:hypothetical protein n=1 Tax=Leisingera aquaemixtae TaxID=1396826 RepID=UPI001C989637|nr:hypothetical protein [Leisingera aquaemixtae]MBY6065324.1 hypothetical protein [Leisingera aquaemixtae]